jgi:predicted DNA-binding transcriptional regulator YafY
MDVGSTPDLRSWILSFGSGAEVLEPEALRAEVAHELEEARVRYKSAP